MGGGEVKKETVKEKGGILETEKIGEWKGKGKKVN